MGCSQSRKEFSLSDVDEFRHVVLLFGLPDSGKRTLVKQMKIIYAEGFQEEDRIKKKDALDMFLVRSIKYLLTNESIRKKITSNDYFNKIETSLAAVAEYEEVAASILQEATQDKHSLLLNIIKNWIELIRVDDFVKSVNSSSVSKVIQLRQHLFNNPHRFLDENYIPSINDVLNVSGEDEAVLDMNINLEDSAFRVVELGTQQSDCRKWTHHFQDIDAIIYVVDISAYEDGQRTGAQFPGSVKESLRTFRKISSTKWFSNSTMILFLNKSDVFRAKVKEISIKSSFPEYTGDGSYEDSLQYIRWKFERLYTSCYKRQIFTFTTCAVNTESMKKIFEAAAVLALRNEFHTTGFL